MIQGGIAKAYGDYCILKVDAITVITTMSGESRDRGRQILQQNKKEIKKDFHKMLGQACENVHDGFSVLA